MLYYLDTSIWLDFFENRNEPEFPKGEWAHALLKKIIEDENTIIVSNQVLLELGAIGYNSWEIEFMFKSLKPFLIFVEATKNQIGKANDLSKKRNIPKGDALHALISKDNRAILVTFDKHFQEIKDIIQPKRPQDLI